MGERHRIIGKSMTCTAKIQLHEVCPKSAKARPRGIPGPMKSWIPVASVAQGATLSTASAEGNFSGSGIVTLPVAAHSVPRWMTDWKPTQRIE